MGKAKKQRAQARRTQAMAARAREARRRLWLWVGLGALGVALVVVLYLASDYALPGQAVPIMGNQHIPSPDFPHPPYNSDPPTSGPHTPQLAPWGIHDEPVPKQILVHNLEDGGVVIYYHAQVEGETLDKLKAIVSRYDRHVILVPYPQMDRRFALTAWGRLDKFDRFDERRIVRFINAYRGIDWHR